MTRLDENGKPMTIEESLAADEKAKKADKKDEKKTSK
jgi:hypothetical protein